jgi:uncharacterized membrane protein
MKIKASKFFSKDQQFQILTAIREAEESTSGEIRVHIETSCSEDVLDRGAWLFIKLGMHKTAARNSILFYLAIKERKYVILGDAGINAIVPEDFWDNVNMLLQKNFTKGKFTEGLVEGILMAGQQLKIHFPHMKDDINELPDELSFDNPDFYC